MVPCAVMMKPKELWCKMVKTFFFPEEERALFWVLVGPVFLCSSALVLLASLAPLQALLLFMGSLLLLVSYFAPERIAQLAFVLLALFSLYCLRTSSVLSGWFGTFWAIQLILSLYISQQSVLSGKEIIRLRKRQLKELDSDNHLWRSRFETLCEKMESDREVWESEIELERQKSEENVAYMESLRRLIETAHAQIRELEQKHQDPSTELRAAQQELDDRLQREEELKERLAATEKQLDELRQVSESRRARNHDLLTTSKEKPITLANLAKRIK